MLSNTPEEFVTEIIMTRTAQPNRAIVIIEGRTDWRLLAGFKSKNCELIPTDGADKAIKVTVIVEKRKLNGVIAILDADFRILEQEDLPEIVYLTDTSDLETMLVQSPALDKMLRNTISFNRNTDVGGFCNYLREIGLQLCSPMGYLRWVDYRNRNFNISLNSISFAKIIDFKRMQVNETLLMKIVDENSNPQITIEEIQAELDELQERDVDKWNLCQGHDLLAIIAAILPHITKQKLGFEMSDKQKIQTATQEISRGLRMSYEFSYFQNTGLYQSLRDWEQQNPPFLVLKEA